MSGISFCGFFSLFTATQITVVLTDWIFSYTVYRFLSAFFPVKQRKNKIIEIISYFLFWIIGSIQFLFCNTIAANIIYNLLSVFLITFNYNGKMQIRILAPLMIYVTGAAVEFLTAGFNTTAYFLKSPEGSITIANIIEDRILFFTAGTLVSKLKNIKDGEIIPAIYWAAFIAIPILTFIFVPILLSVPLSYIQFIICTGLIFILDVLIYFVFDRMLYLQQKNRKSLVYDLQNESYRQQLDIMNESLKNTKVMRHDIKNQMLVIQGLLEKKDIEGALNHIQTITNEWSFSRKTINTGNVEIDSLINFKLSQAEQLHIAVTTNISIPEKIALRPFDTAALIGNLFDNAFDALKQIEESSRLLSITLRYSKGRLFIVFSNQYKNELRWKDGYPQSQKTDAAHHGIGLKEIENIAALYNGQLTIVAENGKFAATVMMYV